jgi:hypothetical protein
MPYGQYGSPHYGVGDYYRGDWITDLGKSVINKAAGAAKKAAQNWVTGMLGGGVKPTALPPPTPVGLPTTWAKRQLPTFAPTGTQGIPQIPKPGAGGAIERFLPGGASGYLTATYGYHANKAYVRYLRAKEAGHDVQNPMDRPRVVNPIVRNRALNPANPRALRRAVRRQQGFIALARRVMRGTGMTIKRSGFGKTRRHRGFGKR